ncbi:VanZ family protein [Microbacterium sp. 3J1]|uniref:VanZ family protein n=1 Tax=Microbacterium sp. 3J1 TaxID=861269 RepID=UPI000AB637D1|nr:VanZ family protein [Microbacterium sp. 3J1]
MTSPLRRRRVVLASRVLLVPYLAVVALIVWLPGKDAESVTGIVAMTARMLAGWGVPFEVGYPVLEFAANIALFVPFGALVAAAWPALPAWKVVAAGAATSVVIELVQIALPTRYPTVSDVVANTLGAAVGFALVRWLRRGAASSRD